MIDILYASVHADGRPYAPGEWPLARALVEGEAVVSEEVECVVADGTSATFSVNATAIRDPEGVIVAAVATLSDVTHRRRVERHLRQVQQMETVGRLAGGMAHEANNQMSVILGSAQFVLRRPDIPDAVREDVEQIQRAAERTAGITAQLLAFSRRQVLQPAGARPQCSGAALGAGAAPHAGGALPPRRPLRPASSAGSRPTGVSSSRCCSTWRSTPATRCRDGGARDDRDLPTSRSTPEYAALKPVATIVPGPYVLLTVGDTGDGMDRADARARVRAVLHHQGRRAKAPASGLATVYGIVKQSGGYIWVYSEPGQGTTFKIYLPAVETGAVEPTSDQPVSAGAVAGEVVLVVEDEESVRTMLARLRRAKGMRYSRRKTGAKRWIWSSADLDQSTW